MVESLGTPTDRENMEMYEKEFNEYAKRRVFECPPKFGEPKFNHTNIAIKLDDHYENCTLNKLKLLEEDFCKILNITNLTLCLVARGCLQLTFQLPQFVQKQIFPLSREQEVELLALDVISVICGDYYLTAEVRYPSPFHNNYYYYYFSNQQPMKTFAQKEFPTEVMTETISGQINRLT